MATQKKHVFLQNMSNIWFELNCVQGFLQNRKLSGNEKENNNQIKTECSNCTHRLFLISVLCNYFARENHNYPFCSPAFTLKLFFDVHIITYAFLKVNALSTIWFAQYNCTKRGSCPPTESSLISPSYVIWFKKTNPEFLFYGL